MADLLKDLALASSSKFASLEKENQSPLSVTQTSMRFGANQRLGKQFVRRAPSDAEDLEGCRFNFAATSDGMIIVDASVGNGNACGMKLWAAILLVGNLSTEEKRGIVMYDWELGHLCSNWSCMY